MKKYPKIETLLNRDDKFKVIGGQWRIPEFEYLKDNQWLWTEKIDGTNIRIGWMPEIKGIKIGGRTDNAQIPTFLLTKLNELFTTEKMLENFPETSVCLYGEGYGAKIQKGGGNYISDGVDFILFDVKIGDWWLERSNIEGIADKLGIKVVPIMARGSLNDAINFTRHGFNSTFGNFIAEGLVVRPEVTLFTRKGDRVIGKIKYKDF